MSKKQTCHGPKRIGAVLRSAPLLLSASPSGLSRFSVPKDLGLLREPGRGSNSAIALRGGAPAPPRHPASDLPSLVSGLRSLVSTLSYLASNAQLIKPRAGKGS